MSDKNDSTLDLDATKTAPAGLKWLFEMEALNSPVLLNTLYGNVYSFNYVKDAEILIDRHNQRMLLYVEFTWIVRKIAKNRKKVIIEALLDNLQELLPSFNFRIIEDKTLFDTAVKRLADSLQGVPNEEIPSPNPDSAASTAASNSDGGKDQAGSTNADSGANRPQFGPSESDPSESPVS